MCLPNHIAEDPQLADDINKLCLLLPRPDHVVGGDGGLDPVHQDVGIPLWRVLDFLQERFDICSVDIVATTFPLGLQHKLLWGCNCSSEGLVTSSILSRRRVLTQQQKVSTYMI